MPYAELRCGALVKRANSGDTTRAFTPRSFIRAMDAESAAVVRLTMSQTMGKAMEWLSVSCALDRLPNASTKSS